MNWWRNPLSPRRVSRRAVVRRAGVALAVLAVAIVAVLPSTTTVHAQANTIEMFVNSADQMFHRGSFDNGATWTSWQGVASVAENFRWPPHRRQRSAGASPGDGQATGSGTLGLYDYFTWQGWSVFQRLGSTTNGVVVIGRRRYTLQGDPGVASWGSGRFDAFLHAVRDDGVTALVHTWANNGRWVGVWEELGTGTMQGSPAAVSGAPIGSTSFRELATAGSPRKRGTAAVGLAGKTSAAP